MGHQYTGTTNVLSGTLVVAGDISYSSQATVALNCTLAGTGLAPQTISGLGMVSPGASPGILTTGQLIVDTVGVPPGLDFAFEITQADPTYNNPTASDNDVLRLTDAVPFNVAMTLDNVADVYFNVAGGVGPGNQFRGAWYTDTNSSFIGDITGAQFNYFEWDGLAYASYAGEPIVVSTVPWAADFGIGPVSGGYVTQFTAIPEPGSMLLAALASLGMAGYWWRRKRRMKTEG
jgi:hypothetical protein